MYPIDTLTMKTRLLFLVFLLCLPIVFSQDWVFNSNNIELSMDISSNISLISLGSRYNVEYVIANLSFVPGDYFQEDVISINTNPATELKDGSAVFRWNNPTEKELRFSLKSNIQSFNKIVKVKDKVTFPLENLPDDVKIYTKPSATIDSDDKEIVKLASELISGEDDLYVIAFKLGEWTKKNVDYDLSTLTESVSQKASWVLKNREGVCDELTNLFIAMNRALGIPAKFVSGVAYTNSEQFEEGFGPHGWAEVYFPGYGWVPFDVTYGEFGFVDVGHVKLKEGMDANEASTKFQWLGKDVDIKSSPLDINTDIKEIKGKSNDLISINTVAVKKEIGFGSYGLIEANVENLNDYYVSTELGLSKSQEVEVIGENKRTVLLKPDEKKKISWIVKVSNNLDRGYMYTFPFVVTSLRNITSELKFDVMENGKRFSLEGIESLVEESEEEKSYSGDLMVACMVEQNEIYEYEDTSVKCDVKNIGNVYLEDLNICLEEECRKLSLGITEEDKVNFNFKPKEVGVQEIVIKANNKDVSKNALLDISVYDEPSIEIDELVHPTEIEYKDIYEIAFVLNKKSRFAPDNVSIKIEPVDKEWNLNQLKKSRKFVLKMYGNELKAGENNFKIIVTYNDRKGKSYKTSKEFNLKLVNVNIFQRMVIFFKHLF
jgi:translation elongation factor EF-1beta